MLLLLALLFVAVLGVLVVRRRPAPLGPPALPLAGNLHQIDTHALCDTLQQWSLQYGRVFRVHLPQDTLVIGEPALLRQALEEEWEQWDREPRTRERTGEFIGGLVLVPNDGWRTNRDIVRPAFTAESLRLQQPVIQAEVDSLEAHVASLAGRGQAFDLQRVLQGFALDVIARLVAGLELGCGRPLPGPYAPAFERCLQHLMVRLVSPVPFWRWLPSAGVRRFEEDATLFKRALQGRVQTYLKDASRDHSVLAQVPPRQSQKQERGRESCDVR